MSQNGIPAIFSLVVTILLASMLAKKFGNAIGESDLEIQDGKSLSVFVLALLVGILMAGTTASTTADATAQTFTSTLTSAGVPALSTAAIIHENWLHIVILKGQILAAKL